MGWVKAHLKDNHPATRLNERKDELTKIRKITVGPEWYQFEEWLHQPSGHTGKEALYCTEQRLDPLIHKTEIYLENKWSWDSTNQLPQLLEIAGQETKVGSQMVSESTHEKTNQIYVIEVKSKINRKKNCATERLDFLYHFVLVQIVFVVWIHHEVGLSFKFKIA